MRDQGHVLPGGDMPRLPTAGAVRVRLTEFKSKSERIVPSTCLCMPEVGTEFFEDIREGVPRT